ncbi:MAG: hypothetical protein HC938_09930 [Nitrospira sp.]|nr:hypothetical protein [Nitrospira sp.]
MRGVWRQFPDDPDAGVLFAEALMDLRPWDLWTAGGQPRPGTEEIVSTLESILARFPDHPGACHYYIHSVEASPKPERALECAKRLPDLMPGAGHIVHMPAHIYMRLGRYHDVAEQNAHAAHVDEEYLAKRKLSGDYADAYYTHNLHFLWASLMMAGRKTEALTVARQLTRTITEQEARKDTWKEFYLPAALWSMIRFGNGMFYFTSCRLPRRCACNRPCGVWEEAWHWRRLAVCREPRGNILYWLDWPSESATIERQRRK